MSEFQQAVDQATPEPQFPKESTQQQEVQTTTSSNQPQVTHVEDGSIVVNGKIYKLEAAVKKIEHADQHIKTLEQENAEKDVTNLQLLERLEAMEKQIGRADALDKLVQEVSTPPAPIEQPQTQEVSKEELIEATVSSIKAEQVAEQQEANLNACVAAAQEAYGDAYGLEVDTIGLKHGMNVEQVMDMARNQPTVFQAIFLPEGKKVGSPNMNGSTVGGNEGLQSPAPPKQTSFLKMGAKQRQAEIQKRLAALSQQE